MLHRPDFPNAYVHELPTNRIRSPGGFAADAPHSVQTLSQNEASQHVDTYCSRLCEFELHHGLTSNARVKTSGRHY